MLLYRCTLQLAFACLFSFSIQSHAQQNPNGWLIPADATVLTTVPLDDTLPEIPVIKSKEFATHFPNPPYSDAAISAFRQMDVFMPPVWVLRQQDRQQLQFENTPLEVKQKVAHELNSKYPGAMFKDRNIKVLDAEIVSIYYDINDEVHQMSYKVDGNKLSALFEGSVPTVSGLKIAQAYKGARPDMAGTYATQSSTLKENFLSKIKGKGGAWAASSGGGGGFTVKAGPLAFGGGESANTTRLGVLAQRKAAKDAFTEAAGGLTIVTWRGASSTYKPSADFVNKISGAFLKSLLNVAEIAAANDEASQAILNQIIPQQKEGGSAQPEHKQEVEGKTTAEPGKDGAKIDESSKATMETKNNAKFGSSVPANLDLVFVSDDSFNSLQTLMEAEITATFTEKSFVTSPLDRLPSISPLVAKLKVTVSTEANSQGHKVGKIGHPATDANIYIDIGDDFIKSIPNIAGDQHEAGTTETHVMDVPQQNNLTIEKLKISKISLRRDGTSHQSSTPRKYPRSPDWKCSSITIEYSSDGTSFFKLQLDNATPGWVGTDGIVLKEAGNNPSGLP